MNIEILSKHRNEIYGISAIWIVLFHATSGYGLDVTFGFSILDEVESWLKLSFGVDVFIFLSGVSLFFSFSKNPSYESFISRRIGRIIPALLLTWAIKWVVLTLLGEHSLAWLIWQLTLVPFFIEGNNNGSWFISIIVFLYFIFPYLYSFIYSNEQGELKESKNELVLLLRTAVIMAFFSLIYWLAHKYDIEWFSKVEIGLGRIPLFVFGVYVGHLVRDKVSFNSKIVFVAILASLLWVVLLKCYVLVYWPWWWRLFASFSGVLFSLIFASLFEAISRIALGKYICAGLRSVGTYSLELYGTHCIMFRGIGIIPAVTGNALLILLYGFISFAYSWGCVRYLEPRISRCGAKISKLFRFY